MGCVGHSFLVEGVNGLRPLIEIRQYGLLRANSCFQVDTALRPG